MTEDCMKTLSDPSREISEPEAGEPGEHVAPAKVSFPIISSLYIFVTTPSDLYKDDNKKLNVMFYYFEVSNTIVIATIGNVS